MLEYICKSLDAKNDFLKCKQRHYLIEMYKLNYEGTLM